MSTPNRMLHTSNYLQQRDWTDNDKNCEWVAQHWTNFFRHKENPKVLQRDE
jgi:hypothetical protein